LNATGASNEDYIATYDPATSQVSRLRTPDFNNGRGLSLHGMDVVPSSSDPQELFIYLVNHRIPLGDRSAEQIGADSVIEIFKTTIGGEALIHIKTVEDPIIVTPNDVVGSADGKSFYFTNDHDAKVGLVSFLFYPLHHRLRDGPNHTLR
jgi:arylesterase / paraoxonase